MFDSTDDELEENTRDCDQQINCNPVIQEPERGGEGANGTTEEPKPDSEPERGGERVNGTIEEPKPGTEPERGGEGVNILAEEPKPDTEPERGGEGVNESTEEPKPGTEEAAALPDESQAGVELSKETGEKTKVKTARA